MVKKATPQFNGMSDYHSLTKRSQKTICAESQSGSTVVSAQRMGNYHARGRQEKKSIDRVATRAEKIKATDHALCSSRCKLVQGIAHWRHVTR